MNKADIGNLISDSYTKTDVVVYDCLIITRYEYSMNKDKHLEKLVDAKLGILKEEIMRRLKEKSDSCLG